MKYIITGKGYISELTKQIEEDVISITEEELKQSAITINKNDKVYAPTESSLDIIIKKSEDENFVHAVEKLKDKYQFRKLMSEIYPDFFYEKCKLDELEKTELEENKKYVIKPVKGFFSTAVKQINGGDNLKLIAEEIYTELNENTKYFSESILSKNELIIEQFIEGDEYAVDMYFNDKKEPVIINIYHHPFPEQNEYFNVLYYTNHQIFDKLYDRINTIFIELNKHLKIADFPIHAEFKLENDKLIPIEMNPLRYGGFGLADLTYHAFGFNPFNAFFQNFKPDWNKIWNKYKKNHFGWVLGYNGKDINTKTHTPDDDAYLKYLKETLHYVEIDHRKNPVFSLAYIKDDCEISLKRLLKTEFNDFFVPNDK
ncbi:MAG: ATP-grasp domain-containing protein [Candidatus Cloacimonetes bacterium]|nr:ATP-grasp domain-containing protein [Candidatus Cloacimonadota bacterium]MCF7813592.1 ATP-grasp domain-containing protein [Candidatus Cloacimonadota bacterium]MCF7867908.1 ATP-grasp domain-containing protein [Candidatus Cloacimonadota bacterium]MCF7882899.1 ATP-grasp domain-containing protein [Candidatus Cloacimonadota bacterium]